MLPSRRATHALPKCPDVQGTCVLPKRYLSATSMCYLGPTYLNVLSQSYLRATHEIPTCYRMLPHCFRELPTATDVLPKRCLGATRASEVLPMCDQQTTKALHNAPSMCYPIAAEVLPHVLSKCCRSATQVFPGATHALPKCDRSAT